jgi:aminoglycoside phosphotransferase (APT) family kinase protein
LFLKRLHGVKGFVHPTDGTDFDQIKKYQKMLRKAESVFKAYFSDEETSRIDAFFMRGAPERLALIGQDLVFCHGDFGYNNILLDGDLTAGVIDFGDAGLFDRSKDFVDLDDETVLKSALGVYGGDETLLEKIRIWQKMLPIFLMLFYIDRKETDGIEECVKKIKGILVNGL